MSPHIILAIVLAMLLVSIVVVTLVDNAKRQKYSTAQRQDKSLWCWHGTPAIDCAECKPGPRPSHLARAEWRRIEMHNRKVAKHAINEVEWQRRASRPGQCFGCKKALPTCPRCGRCATCKPVFCFSHEVVKGVAR